MIRFLAFVLLLSLLVAVYGLFIYLVFGSFRFYSGFAGFGRMYLNWGYAAANGAIIAFPLLIFSRTLSPRQLVAGAAFGICAGFLLVGSGRGPLLSLLFACCIALLAGLPQISRGRIDVPRWQIIALFCLIVAGSYVAYLTMTGTAIATFNRFAKLLRPGEITASSSRGPTGSTTTRQPSASGCSRRSSGTASPASPICSPGATARAPIRTTSSSRCCPISG